MNLDVVVLGSAFVEFSPMRLRRELRDVKYFKIGTGGSATNLATALSRLGLKVGLLSCVGEDEFGEFVVQDLRKEGLDVSKIKIVRGYQTGVSFYQVDESNRKRYFFYRFPGFSDPESALSEEDVEPAYLKSSRAFAFTEASVRKSPSREAAFKAASIAKREGLLTLYDPNYRAELWLSVQEARKISMKAFELADLVTPNQSEAALITGRRKIRDMLRKSLDLGPRVVAIKRGRRGSVIAEEDRVDVIPAFKVRVLDDTGAGDAFCAGLLYGLLMGWPLRKCGIFGNAVAAIKLGRRGGKEGMPYFHEVKEFLTRRDFR